MPFETALRVLSHATNAPDPLQELLVHSQPIYVFNDDGQAESASLPNTLLSSVSGLREVSWQRVLVSRDCLTLVRT